MLNKEKISQLSSHFGYSLVFLFLLLAFVVRILPGKDHFLWNTSDYPRDAYVMREMIVSRDIKLTGPRAEIYDPVSQGYYVFHGPLYYYLLSPFYYFSQGDPNLPLIANIVIHLSAIIPLWFLIRSVTKDKRCLYLLGIFWLVSVEQIEYSRWLLNPSLAVPFLAWFFYGLWLLWTNQKQAWIAGLALGLAIQNEIFLGYLLVAVLIMLIVKKVPWKEWSSFGLSLGLGLLPLILAEVKYRFRMSLSLWHYFSSGGGDQLTWQEKGLRLWEHWGVVAHHNLWGFSQVMSLILLTILLIYLYKQKSKLERSFAVFVSILFFVHSILFVTSFQNSIYIDLGMGLLMLMVVTLGVNRLWQKQRMVAVILTLSIVVSQLLLLRQHQLSGQPFGGHFFLQSDVFLYSDRLSLAAKMYQLASNQPFSISVLETPYGWPTMWASIFEQYSTRYSHIMPKWFGFYVHGSPGDLVFQTVDQPLPIHFLLYPTSQIIDQQTVDQVISAQNVLTQVDQVIVIGNYTIEKRSLKKP